MSNRRMPPPSEDSPGRGPTPRRRLWIEPSMGMAGDMFAAALLALGAPEKDTIAAMETAATFLGDARVKVAHGDVDDGARARQITVDAVSTSPMPIAEAPDHLEEALRQTDIRGGYAGFAHRALAILCRAERVAHDILGPVQNNDSNTIGLTAVGTAHTPYHEQAPYQPSTENQSGAENFFIEIEPDFAAGLAGLDSFSHVFVLSYLERSPGYSMSLRPPWKNDARRYGLFATRSPNRPSPIGLTRVRLRRIEGARLYTDSLDLFDGTPILDIKPYIQSLDGDPGDSFENVGRGNDGWLAGSDHLELHRRGEPHAHPGGGQLHEAQDILVDVVGAAWALQYLAVDLERVTCVAPVRVGGGQTPPTSHGRLPVPAPATRAILEQYEIPHAAGPVSAELFTPTGAAILAALSPVYVTQMPEATNAMDAGVGLGQKVFSTAYPNALRLFLDPKSDRVS